MRMDESTVSSEIAHVLFVDIVGYSLQPIDRQTEFISRLKEIVQQTVEFQRANDNKELISLPTGDGMGLVFQRDPLSPVRCALQIAASLLNHRELGVRMGIHSGPVQRHADIREQVNIVGGGINTAQRVMDCGDAGHILLSRNVAEVLEQFSEFRDCLQDLGLQVVKHGVKIHLYNLIKEPLGNPAMPRKLVPTASVNAAGAALPDTTQAPSKVTRRAELIHRVIRFAGVFLVACVLGVGFESWLQRGIDSGESAAISQAAYAFGGLYQRIVAAPRSPIPRYTVVVEIDPEREPGLGGLHDVCRQRKTMAILIRRIAAAMPSAIIIDKFFGQTDCPGEINPALTAAMSEVSAKVALVVGRQVLGGGYLQPSFLVGLPDLKEAIVNIDPDTRKLPLKWQVFPTKADMERNTGLVWYETLSLKAAEAQEKGRLTERHPRLAKLLNPVQHPYISFLGLQQFEQFRFPAGYILCGREVRPGEDATACSGSPKDLAALSGKIVLIGEISPEADEHLTVLGRIPGVYLQANFIEALLDDRYYQGVPKLGYLFGFFFLAGLELILAVFRRSWVKMVSIIALLVLVLLFLLYVVISGLHYYVNPLPFIALALLIRALATNLPFKARHAA